MVKTVLESSTDWMGRGAQKCTKEERKVSLKSVVGFSGWIRTTCTCKCAVKKAHLESC